MKLAIKYGLIITVVVVLWIVVVRLILKVEPDSNVHTIGPLLFNIVAIIAIFLAMRAKKREQNGQLGFKQGLKVGMAVSLVYAVSSCLFFLIQFLVAGPQLLMNEAGPVAGPIWRIAAIAYGGLFFGSLFFGLIYSTIIAFFLARMQGRESSELI